MGKMASHEEAPFSLTSSTRRLVADLFYVAGLVSMFCTIHCSHMLFCGFHNPTVHKEQIRCNYQQMGEKEGNFEARGQQFLSKKR